MSSTTGQLICTLCKSDHAGPKRPMLRCSSCKKGWHTYCHSPVITVGQYKAMYEAEVNRKAHPGAIRFSTWHCSGCSIRPLAEQGVLVISSDEEENTPKRSVGPSKSKSPSAATPTEEVIDLTEGFSELPSRKDRSRTRGTSPPQSRSQTLDLLGWEEYRSPLAGIRLQPQQKPSITPPPPPASATPSEPTIIIGEEDSVDLEMRVDVDTNRDEPPTRPTPAQLLSPGPSTRTETRLLPQIIKEEMQEIVIPPLAESEKPRRPRKPRETKRFTSTSRKGKLRAKSFVNLYMPFGPETTPRVDLGTLEEALRKLGLEPGSG